MKFWLLAAIVVVALECGSAEARPRDEAMSVAFRCAVIDDGRQWLNCYYGAAQPMRGYLGLPPATQTQLKIAAAPPAGVGMDSEASQARDAVMIEAVRCTSLSDDRQWLDCYYAAAQPMRAKLGLPPAPQAPASNAHSALDRHTVPEPQRVDRSGRTAATDHGTSQHIIAHITDYKFDARGILTVMLANGQTWRQVGGDTSLAKLKAHPGNYIATIKPGFFGSHDLTVKGVPGVFRVRKID
jgi:hypothetical protein